MNRSIFDFVIVGSGFSGSLLARILCRAGHSVCLLDHARHPRFSLGESSTPLADFLLERIAQQYKLPDLASMARYGSWKQQLPELTCGKKRGFSYLQHKHGQRFIDDQGHTTSALIAASENDLVSDTHWYRSEVDHWLARSAVEDGVELLEEFRLSSVHRESQVWQLAGSHRSEAKTVSAHFLIDGTPGGQFATAANKAVDESAQLRTITQATYAHFRDVGSIVPDTKSDALAWPFHADDAAQHHLLEDGWIWMLRFDSGITSVGWVQQASGELHARSQQDVVAEWSRMLENYPSLQDILGQAQVVAPFSGLQHIPRISRLCRVAKAEALAVLPNAVGIVDPLHSTGIAHSLNGVVRLAEIILRHRDPGPALDGLHQSFFQELLWIDELVSLCYLAQQDSFELFLGACSFYFVSAIHSERQMAKDSELEQGFLLHQNQQLRKVAVNFRSKTRQLLSLSATNRMQERKRLIDWLRGQLAPWNDVGLLDPSNANRIQRAATK